MSELYINALRQQCRDYLEYMTITHMSPDTVSVRERHLKYFCDWCEERGLESPYEISRNIIERYQSYLFNYRKVSGGPLAISTQHGRLKALRAVFRHLVKNHLITYNPAADLELPRLSNRLPRQILTVEEVEAILIQPNMSTPEGIRDRAILEILYSTAIRRAEVLGLSIYDIDFDRSIVFIREGKGRKDRVVPIGKRALDFLRIYLQSAREKLLLYASDSVLFLGKDGKVINRNHLTDRVKKYILEAGVNKKGACHIFRHTAATLMLENGADIRYIQQMLGHSNLTTTQIYTHVSIKQLKNVHTLTHPANHKQDSGPIQKSEPPTS